MPTQSKPETSSGSLIILAWPETFVRMVPRWYSAPLRLGGIVKDGFIRAGHAAAILVDNKSGNCKYTDFGRYITPDGHGRSRTHFTDPELQLETIASFDAQGNISNLISILSELDLISSHTHGDGKMYVSLRTGVDFRAANDFIDSMNERGSMPYDPFRKGATNCSRYVYDLINHACPNANLRTLKLRSFPAAAPLSNVFWGGNIEPGIFEDASLTPISGSRLICVLKNFLGRPEKPGNDGNEVELPKNVHLLTGTGSNGWFLVEAENDEMVLISRLDKDGSLIFKRQYKPVAAPLDLEKPYELVHDTHGLVAAFVQDGKRLTYRTV